MWDERNDAAQHPAWCFCPACGGGPGGEAITDATGDHAYDCDCPACCVLRAACDFVEQTARNVSRTVFQTYREDNHMERGKQQGQRARNGLPFLNVADLTTDKKRVKIEWAGAPERLGANRWGHVVAMRIRAIESGVEKLWSLADKNPVLDVLCAAMTEDENKWIGRELFLFVEQDDVTRAKYIRAEVIANL